MDGIVFWGAGNAMNATINGGGKLTINTGSQSQAAINLYPIKPVNLTIEDCQIDLNSKENQDCILVGQGCSALIQNVTGTFSSDVSKSCAPNYWTKLNESTSKYEFVELTEADATCKVTQKDGTVLYIAGSIYQAMNLAKEEAVITLLKDYTINESNTSSLGASKVTIDLNGKTLTTGSYSWSFVKYPEENIYVCVTIDVTIKNGTIVGSMQANENANLTLENVTFENSSFKDTALKLYSDIKAAQASYATYPAVNALVCTNCTFTNSGVQLNGGNEAQKIDATFTGCTFTATITSGVQSCLSVNNYVYGSLVISNTTFTLNNKGNNKSYCMNISTSSSGDMKGKQVSATFTNVKMYANSGSGTTDASGVTTGDSALLYKYNVSPYTYNYWTNSETSTMYPAFILESSSSNNTFTRNDKIVEEASYNNKVVWVESKTAFDACIEEFGKYKETLTKDTSLDWYLVKKDSSYALLRKQTSGSSFYYNFDEFATFSAGDTSVTVYNSTNNSMLTFDTTTDLSASLEGGAEDVYIYQISST